MTKKKKICHTFLRFASIAKGNNSDHSDEYYTLYHAYAALLLELLCRHQKGKDYKVIICPCDSETSVFRHLEKDKDMIGSPKVVYSAWPADWRDYFDMDYEKEYGARADEVLIFTNPPFRGLGKAMGDIKCDFLLFGSNAVNVPRGTFIRDTKGFIYINNIDSYNGSADDCEKKYSKVHTCFYSNRRFETQGQEWYNNSKERNCLIFGKDKMERIK